MNRNNRFWLIITLVVPFVIPILVLSIPEEDYQREGKNDEIKDMEFLSLKRDEINLIITKSQKFVDKFLLATSLTKRLNLMDKDDRIAVFRAVLYGEIYDHIPEKILVEVGL